MALYTPFSSAQLDEVAHEFGLGKVIEAVGVPEGSINTNYQLVTDQGRFFMRHTTVRSADDLTFESALLAHLSAAHFPGPKLISTRQGMPFFSIADGRASVFAFLVGEELSRAAVTEAHLEALGKQLGKLHRETESFVPTRENPYRFEVVQGWVFGLRNHSDGEVARAAETLVKALDQVENAPHALVPRGVIHADLFMDNVKWIGNRVAAFFDFEMACTDFYMLDLAITLNAWCFEGQFRSEKCAALVRGYQQERAISEHERKALHRCALFGAVRYAASRIRDFHLSPLPKERLARKDFRTYLARTEQLMVVDSDRFAHLLGLKS